MTVGKLVEIMNCQIRGQVSQDSLSCIKTTGWMYTVRRETDKKTERPPGQTLCGQRFGKICPMRRNARTGGISRNQSSTMPEDCVVFISLIPMMRNSRTSENARRKLEIPMPAAMLRKLQRDKYREACRTVKEHKAKYACFVDKTHGRICSQ